MNHLRNSVQLIGNLGADVELRATTGGRPVANARLATSDVYKNKDGEKITSVQWHDIVAWGKDAETLAQYGKKGKELAVSGRLVHRSYENQAGDTRYVTEVVVREFMLLR